MSKPYRFTEDDKHVIAAVEQLLRRLVCSGSLRPAQLISVAKVLHLVSRLPRVTPDVCVTIDLCFRIQQEGCRSSSMWHFFAGEDSLNLSCGGSEYTEGVGSDAYTSMEWSAQPGERTEYDGNWDVTWMERDDHSDPPAYSSDFSDCDIAVDDDDNPFFFEPEEPAGDEEVSSSEIGLELYRRGEKIDVFSDEWRAALETFKDWGWEPEPGLDRYAAPPAFIKHNEGSAMREAGLSLWREIDQVPALMAVCGQRRVYRGQAWRLRRCDQE
jgi:hypothetical protein